MKIVINGISGKMGSFVYEYFKNINEYKIAGGISRKVSLFDIPIYQNIESCMDNTEFDVLIDFSLYPFCLAAVKAALQKGINVVSGTTGYKKQDVKNLTDLAKNNNCGIIVSPNFSLFNGDILNFVTGIKKLFPYIEIIEEHSNHKKDKPSGTANYFAKILSVHKDKIHSVRLPGIIARHEIIFSDGNQSISLSHTINNRYAFMKEIERSVTEVINNKTINILV